MTVEPNAENLEYLEYEITCMTICLADLPLILISSCCFKVLYTCSPWKQNKVLVWMSLWHIMSYLKKNSWTNGKAKEGLAHNPSITGVEPHILDRNEVQYRLFGSDRYFEMGRYQARGFLKTDLVLQLPLHCNLASSLLDSFHTRLCWSLHFSACMRSKSEKSQVLKSGRF